MKIAGTDWPLPSEAAPAPAPVATAEPPLSEKLRALLATRSIVQLLATPGVREALHTLVLVLSALAVLVLSVAVLAR